MIKQLTCHVKEILSKILKFHNYVGAVWERSKTIASSSKSFNKYADGEWRVSPTSKTSIILASFKQMQKWMLQLLKLDLWFTTISQFLFMHILIYWTIILIWIYCLWNLLDGMLFIHDHEWHIYCCHAHVYFIKLVHWKLSFSPSPAQVYLLIIFSLH